MEVPPPTRRRFQFSLRTLLVFVTLSALACSWLAVRMRDAKREAASAAVLEKAGVTVVCGDSGPGPAWLRSVLGEHFFRHAVKVWLGGNQVTPSALEPLDEMHRLQSLALYGPKVDDASMRHLQGLRELKELDISETRLTDAGLENLAELQRLETLTVASTKVTDAGLRTLARLKKLVTLSLAQTNVTDAGLEHLHRMRQLTELQLSNTHVTEGGAAKLRQALPNCQIDLWP